MIDRLPHTAIRNSVRSRGLRVPATTVSDARSMVAVMRLWPAHDPQVLPHDHPDLPKDHPHLHDHGPEHQHALVIDDLHRTWPKPA